MKECKHYETTLVCPDKDSNQTVLDFFFFFSKQNIYWIIFLESNKVSYKGKIQFTKNCVWEHKNLLIPLSHICKRFCKNNLKRILVNKFWVRQKHWSGFVTQCKCCVFFSDGAPSSYDGLNNRVSWTYGDFKDLEISNKLKRKENITVHPLKPGQPGQNNVVRTFCNPWQNLWRLLCIVAFLCASV